MAIEQYIHGVSRCDGRRVLADKEPVIRIVALEGCSNPHENLVFQTLSGRVLLRSIDGRKSSRATPDIFVDTDSNVGPIVVVAT